MKNFFIVTVSFIVFAPLALAENFRMEVGAETGWGKIKNRTGSIANRTIWTHSLNFSPAYILNEDWQLGLTAQYAFRRQATDPRQVGDTTLKGDGFSLGLLGKYQWSNVTLRAHLDFLGRYGLSEKDAVGQEITYKCNFGFCGFGVGAAIPVAWGIDGVLGLRYQRWSRVDVNSVENDISQNRLSEWRATLGASYSFSL